VVRIKMRVGEGASRRGGDNAQSGEINQSEFGVKERPERNRQ